MTIGVGTKYRSKHVDQRFDAIVIGSGMGGMTAASLLSQAGHKTLLLEQHYTIGGCTHTFARKGYEWDVGLHYVGDVASETSVLRQVFDTVTQDAVKWSPLPKIFNRFVIGEKLYEIPAGKKAYAAQLKTYFPDEAAMIDEYIDLIYRVNKAGANFFAERAMPRAMADSMHEAMTAEFRPYAERTTYDVLSSMTDNQELIAVLCGNYGDYSLPPKKSAFSVHAQTVKHYMNGASFPIGGPSQIAKSIVEVVEGAGGKVLYSAPVDKILIEDNQAVGVKLRNGDEIKASRVVSGAGVHATFKKMLPREVADQHGLTDLPDTIPAAYTAIGLNIGFAESAESIGLTSSNIWAHPSNDYDGDIERHEADYDQPLPGHFITTPSLRDPTWYDRYPDTATISMYSQVPYDMFRKWEHIPSEERGEEYEQLKQKLANEMLDTLYKWMPETEGKIDYYEISTPLSINKFLGREKGNFMGLEHSPERFKQRWLRADTPIKDLYLTGQDVVGDGIVGAMSSGVLTASAILGKNLFSEILKQKKSALMA